MRALDWKLHILAFKRITWADAKLRSPGNVCDEESLAAKAALLGANIVMLLLASIELDRLVCVRRSLKLVRFVARSVSETSTETVKYITDGHSVSVRIRQYGYAKESSLPTREMYQASIKGNVDLSTFTVLPRREAPVRGMSGTNPQMSPASVVDKFGGSAELELAISGTRHLRQHKWLLS